MTTFLEVVEALIASREHCAGSLGRMQFWVDQFGHLPITEVGEDDVDQAKIEEYYKIAKGHFAKFKEVAGSNKEYKALVPDADLRVIIIDEAFETFRKMEELQKQAEELAKLEAKAAEEERQRLLELEKQAAAEADAPAEEPKEEEKKEEAK